ncbi:MAG: hypothetical protein H7Z14_12350 [Anaerolineae bacterium]|nr:hypothetical protein [Phycisphaerae bacterium]
MCSKNMRAANRRNAQKSTGPKSEEGKSRSSQNAITHGLSARSAVVLDESIEEFDAFAQAVRDDFRPRGPMESVLVDRIIHLSWKLRRIPKIEAEMLVEPDPSLELDLFHDVGKVSRQRISYLMRRYLRGTNDAMSKVQTYEMRMDRTLHATMRELNRLRKMNREEVVHDDTEAQVSEPQNVVILQNEPVLMEQCGPDGSSNPLLQQSRCANLPAEPPPDGLERRSA